MTNDRAEMLNTLTRIADELHDIAAGRIPVPRAVIFAVAIDCVHVDGADGVDIHRVFDALDKPDLDSLLTWIEKDIDGEVL